MKQGLILIYLLTFFLLISCVSALEVRLTAPENDTAFFTTSVSFTCFALEAPSSKENLEEISFKVRQKEGAWWTSPPSPAIDSEEVTFEHNFVGSGAYDWTCLATNNNSENFEAPIKTLYIQINTPPTIGSIPDPQEKDIDISYWRLNLSEYASDNEDPSELLTWVVTGEDTSFCNVEIIKIGIDSMAQFTPASSASPGSDTITFTLTDTGDLTDTQDITITLTATTCTPNWDDCTSWSDCTGGEQTRTCEDSNNCNTSTKTETRDCDNGCIEDWDCGQWSTCSNGRQTRTCTDDNNCDPDDNEKTESRTCSPGSFILEITSSTPSSSKVTMLRGTSKTFRIDTNLINVDIEWYLDDKLQTDTDDDFRYSPLSQDIGNHTIKVIVKDGDDVDAKEWEVTVTEPVPVATMSANKCGNNQTDEGENCLTCPQDAPCKETEVCDEGVCREKKKIWASITGYTTKITDSIIDKWYYTVAILSLILLAMIAFIIQKKRQGKEKPLAQFEEKRPLLGRIRKSLRDWDKKRTQKKENKVKVKQLQKERKEEIRTTAPVGLNQIITFINECSSTGYSRWQIVTALRKKGWSRAHIKQAYEQIQKHDSKKPAKPD